MVFCTASQVILFLMLSPILEFPIAVNLLYLSLKQQLTQLILCSLYKHLGYFNHILVVSVAWLLCVDTSQNFKGMLPINQKLSVVRSFSLNEDLLTESLELFSYTPGISTTIMQPRYSSRGRCVGSIRHRPHQIC